MQLWLMIVSVTIHKIAAIPTRHMAVHVRQPLRQQQQQRHEQSMTEDDEIVFGGAADNEDGGVTTRVVIEPFQLKLSKYSSTFTELELYDLRDTMELVALRNILNYTTSSATTTPMGQIELIKFGGAKQVYNSDFKVVLVKFDFGIAQYDSLPTPDAITINEWIGTAFTTKLLPNLKSNYPDSVFASLENISYGLQYPQDPPLIDPTNPTNNSTPNNGTTGNDTDTKDGDGGGTPDDSANTSKSSSRSNVPLIAGVAVGAAACMMIVLLVAKQRRDNHKKDSTRVLTHLALDFDDSKRPRNGTKSAETSPSSSKGADANHKADTVDARSVADSESEWTVATEAGDTQALKSITPTLNTTSASVVGANTGNRTNTMNDRQINLIMSESFERDRPVAITKDMLTGQWSGRVSNHRSGPHATQQSESVLKPSHFSASDERRVRKAQRAAAAAAAAASGTVPTPDRETSSVSSKGDESSVDDSLFFEQAHEGAAWGQQKEQVSPSNTSKRRTHEKSSLNGNRQIA